MRILICFVFFFMIMILAVAAVEGGSSLIEKTCGGVPYRGTCLQSLSAGGSSGSSDVGGLLCVAVKQVYLNVTDALDYATKMHSSMKEGFSKECVFDCTNSYKDAISFTKDAMTNCDKRAYEEVKNELVSAMADPKICDEYFALVPGNPSPLKDRNDILLQLYSNALAILHLVTGN